MKNFTIISIKRKKKESAFLHCIYEEILPLLLLGLNFNSPSVFGDVIYNRPISIDPKDPPLPCPEKYL